MTYTQKKKIQEEINKRSAEALEVSSSSRSNVCVMTTPIVSTRANTCTQIEAKLICCFLCDRVWDNRGVRSLVLVATHKRQNTIHEKAKEINDEIVLTKIQGHGSSVLDI